MFNCSSLFAHCSLLGIRCLACVVARFVFLFVVCCLRIIMCCLLFVIVFVCCLWYVVCCLWLIVCVFVVCVCCSCFVARYLQVVRLCVARCVRCVAC